MRYRLLACKWGCCRPWDRVWCVGNCCWRNNCRGWRRNWL